MVRYTNPLHGERVVAQSRLEHEDLRAVRMLLCMKGVAGYTLPFHEERVGAKSQETSAGIESYIEDLVDVQTNISSVPLLDDARIRKEAEMIASGIAGTPFYRKMERAGLPILHPLLSSLRTTLQEYEEKGHQITLKVVRKEACKWVYPFMTALGQKVVAHPEHINEIPSNWSLEHGGLYPNAEHLKKIADDVGMEEGQVVTLFNNARRRNFKNVGGLNLRSKPGFAPEVTEKLREWQYERLREQPESETSKGLRKLLMTNYNLTKTQMRDWLAHQRRKKICKN